MHFRSTLFLLLSVYSSSAFSFSSSRRPQGVSFQALEEQGQGNGHQRQETDKNISRRSLFYGMGVVGLAICTPPAQADVTVNACNKAASPPNCVSTASVRQIDLYAAPWTFPDNVSSAQVLAKLKGAISVDSALKIVEQTETSLRVRASRNFSEDEINIVVNADDRVITFQSQQIDGPDVSDFGANRKRLEELRKRAGLQLMGSELATADTGAREGISGQLKAFWGLQSGGGYESVLLDDDDY